MQAIKTRAQVALLAGALLAGCGPRAEPAPATGSETVYTLPGGVEVREGQVRTLSGLQEEAYKLQQEGDPEACASRFAEGLEIIPNHADFHFYRACCLALAGHGDAAMEALRTALDHGYSNGDQIASDEDLQSLRSRADFAPLLARAHASQESLLATDPSVGAVDESGPFETLEELLASFEEDPLGPAAYLLSGRAAFEHQWQRGRSKIHALRRHAEEHAGEAARAELEALRELTAFFPAASGVDEAASAFLAAHGEEHPLAGEARMLQVQALHEAALADPDHPARAPALAAVRAVASEVVERAPDAEGSRAAYLWLTRQAIAEDDAEGMRRGYLALRERWPDDDAFWSRHGQALVPARLIAGGLPDFEARSLQGETVSPETLRGRVVLLDFWATWCVPCVEQFPHLKRLLAENRERGFEVVGFSGDDEQQISRERFDAWLAEHQIPWTIVFDGTGWGNAVYRAFEVQGIPLTILLDRDGRIAGVNLPPEKLDATVAALL